MPWKSERQRRWGNSPAGVKVMGKASVNEFNKASKGMDLPENRGGNAPMKTREKIRNHPSIAGIKIHHIHRGK